MALISNIVIAFIALLHIYIMVLEMFFWDKPFGLKVFGQTKEFATASKILAASQGLYNGFMAAGLFWGLGLATDGNGVKIFFLSCILFAGIFGGATASRKIFVIQAIPAAIGLALVLLTSIIV